MSQELVKNIYTVVKSTMCMLLVISGLKYVYYNLSYSFGNKYSKISKKYIFQVGRHEL